MTINQRIKQVRKNIGMTQTEFGKKIGMGQAGVSKLEQDGTTVIDQNVRLICEAFNINEEWLRTGQGQREAETDDAFMQRMIERYSLPAPHANLVRNWLHLTNQQRDQFLAVLHSLRALPDEQSSAASPAPIAQPIPSAPSSIDIPQELASYQAELEAQAKEQSPSATTSAIERR